MKKSRLPRFLALVIAVIMASAPLSVSAAAFKDVPSGHWAYAAINRVSELKFMSGDLSGNFKPDNMIDKFETVRILAAMAGYKTTGATAAESESYTNAYNKHIGFINLYVNKFSQWNSNVNKEIAFLLEKGILVGDDLNQFVVIVNNKESLRALSREEAAVFLVRLMNRVSSVSTSYTNPFADDSTISASAKPYVYYLRSIGVMSADSKNNFNPRTAVLRSVMAAMIDKTWTVLYPNAVTPTPTPAPTATPSPGTAYTSVSGTISKIYADFRAIQVSSTDAASNNKILPVKTNATITVNGANALFANLVEGMSFTGLSLNGELTSVLAVTTGSASPTPTPVPTDAPGGTGEIPTAGTTILEGTVSSATSASIGILVRMLSPRGDIYTEVRTFNIPSACPITRSGKTVTTASIVKNDLVKATITNGILTKLELQEKDRKFSGEIVGKRVNVTNTGSIPIISVKDSAGNISELVVNEKSYINRRTLGTTTWHNLRVGDTVDITAEYDQLLTMYAYGTYTTVEGTVREIRISAEGCEVTVADASNVLTTYPIVEGGGVDYYRFRVGTKIRIYLDSKEISDFTVVQDVTTTSYIGSVTRVTGSVISVRDNTTGAVRDFSIDSATSIRESMTNKVVSLSVVTLNAQVSITVANATPTKATLISILQY